MAPALQMTRLNGLSLRTGLPLRHALWPAVAAYSTVLLLALILMHVPFSQDYVGADNDDTMRLIEVRNFLAGQGWFNLTEPRLGLAGGTLMHWSRLVDLPIAGLILFFGLFLEPLRAEAAALFVWPLFLAIPTLAAMGLAGRRMGGVGAMHVSLGLTSLLLVTSNRFLPGAIDHHNLQIMLAAIIAAMLIDRHHRALNFGVAGLAVALALAIGAETTPLMAVACLAVAVLWAWHGAAFARPAAAFALAVTLGVSFAFFATVPPQRYAEITCDSLSLGYYGIASVGGSLLFFAALVASRQSRGIRFGLLGAIGVIVLGTALVLAPQCLGNPLADLDPMLKTMWLDGVIEARSSLAQLRTEPGTFGGFYAAGFFAMMVCAFRIARGDRSQRHAVLLAMILVSWLIALIQVRGAIFANLLSILPLSLLIIELRRRSNEDPENLGAGTVYIVSALMAVPSVWAVLGVLLAEGTAGLTGRLRAEGPPAAARVVDDCTSEPALRQLSGLEPGTVAAPSDLGTDILRFSQHRVLSAPYHRNQGGMLTELHIGLSTPREASTFLRGARVSWLAFCATNPQTRQIAEMKADGLYAGLMKGEVPAYLQPLPQPSDSGVKVFKVLPDKL